MDIALLCSGNSGIVFKSIVLSVNILEGNVKKYFLIYIKMCIYVLIVKTVIFVLSSTCQIVVHQDTDSYLMSVIHYWYSLTKC